MPTVKWMPCVSGLLGIENSPSQRQGIFVMQEFVLPQALIFVKIWILYISAWGWPLCTGDTSGDTFTVQETWFSNALKLTFKQPYSEVFSLLFKSYSVYKCRFDTVKHKGYYNLYFYAEFLNCSQMCWTSFNGGWQTNPDTDYSSQSESKGWDKDKFYWVF